MGNELIQIVQRESILAIAAVSLLLVSGCKAADETKASTVHQQREGAEKPADPDAPYYYGLIAEYKTILAKDPNNLAGIIALGNAYYDTGHWKMAASYYERALQIDPGNADVRTDMGTCYRNMGMPDRALAEYRKALEDDAGHLNARYNMGVVYAYDKGEYATAIHIWEELLRMSPTYPQSGSIRARIAACKKALHHKGTP